MSNEVGDDAWSAHPSFAMKLMQRTHIAVVAGEVLLEYYSALLCEDNRSIVIAGAGQSYTSRVLVS